MRGTVVYSDARSGARYEVAKANLDISLPGGARPFRFAGDVDYKGKGRFPGRRPVKVPVKVMACGGGDQQMTEEEAALAEQ